MDFSNREGVRKLRMALLIIGACLLLIMMVLVFMGMFTALAILAGMFLTAALVIVLLNFQYLRIMADKNNMIVRYYSIFSVDRMFLMFEFPVDMLRNVEVKKHFLGLICNIRFTVVVRKGLADYPWVSLSSIPFRERSKLIMELKKLVLQK